MSSAGAVAPGAGATAGGGIVVLADDLIWATRLVGQLRTLGGIPMRVGSAEAFAAAISSGTAGPAGDLRAIVDLTARAYDGVSAVKAAASAGLRVLCVGQHDDAALRRAALDAGAERVYSYRALFENGHEVLAAWLGVPPPAPASRPMPPTGATRDQPEARPR